MVSFGDLYLKYSHLIFWHGAANVKQVLTILFAVILFDVNITALNLLGIILTLVGGGCYAAVEYERKAPTGTATGTIAMLDKSALPR